jgi:NADPH:quinone reductase-like Zn-dependent oxidoreductase
MRAYVVPNGCRTIDGLRRVERPDPQPRAGQVLVRIRAASINRRDQAIVIGTYFGKPVARDTIPLSDGAGEVVAMGDGVTRFKTGDRVVAVFSQTPPGGGPFAEKDSLGSPLDGTLAEQMLVYEDGLVPIPEGLSFEEAACLPCAAVTAWNALMDTGTPVKPGDTVLVLGTGGVSIFALQFAKAAGARVIATSSSDEKLARVQALGASGVVNYRRTPDWHKEVRKLTGGRGVDCVVEVGGAGTLGRSFESLAAGGKVCLIGVLTGRSAEISPYALMWKQAHLHGIRVGGKELFVQMNRAIHTNAIRPIIDKVFAFDDALAAYHYQNAGNFIGKIVISMAAWDHSLT